MKPKADMPIIRLVAASALAVGFVLGYGATHKFWSQETAAWVQAIGSIAAIIGSYLIGERQAERESRREKESQERAARERTQRVGTLIQAAAVDASNRMQRYYETAVHQGTVHQNRATPVGYDLDQIRSEDVPAPILRPFLRLRAEYAEMEGILERRAHRKSPTFDLPLYRTIWEPYKRAYKAYAAVVERYQELNISLGGPYWDGDPDQPRPVKHLVINRED